jgi:hypothetical protein
VDGSRIGRRSPPTSSQPLPRSGRYFRQDRDKGNRRGNQIYDNTGIRALRTLGAGLMAGATSPARPWFRLGTPDPRPERVAAGEALAGPRVQRMHMVFQKSNTYRALHQMYEELGAFGTAASIILPDFQNVIHCYPLTAASTPLRPTRRARCARCTASSRCRCRSW